MRTGGLGGAAWASGGRETSRLDSDFWSVGPQKPLLGAGPQTAGWLSVLLPDVWRGRVTEETWLAPLGAKRSAWANSLLLQFLAGLLSACLSGFPRCHLSGLWVPLGRWLWCLAFSMCAWPVEGGVRDRTCQRQWVTFYLWCQEEALLYWGSHELLEGGYRYRYVFFLIYLFLNKIWKTQKVSSRKLKPLLFLPVNDRHC